MIYFNWTEILFYMAGITLGLCSGFYLGVLYAAGHIEFRIQTLSKLCCKVGMHDWKGLVAMGWDECRVCFLTKDKRR